MEFRLRDFAHPLAIWRLRRRFNQSQWWSADRQSGAQAAQLAALLRHADATVPFWRRRFASAGLGPADLNRPLAALAALPILTKDEIRAHGAELASDRAASYDPRPSQTSGSTGTALRFLLDRPTNVLEFATLWRQFNWAGYRFGDRFADLRGHLVGHPSGIARDGRLNALNLSGFHLTRTRAEHYARALVEFRPVMVRGYPSSISRFASWALEDGFELPSPRAVVTSSETLLEPQRRVIEQAFRAPVFDYYGQMERVAFAGQCPAGSYHVAPEYGVVEILDDRGAAVAPGLVGRVVATGLHQRAMPLVRYDTRDLAAWSATACECGRAAPVLDRVIGRLEDIIVTPDGRHVGRLDAAFKYSPGIRMSRVVQETVAAIRVEIVAGPGYGATDETRLRHELRLRLGDVIRIDIEQVRELPLEPSGKLKFVVSTIGSQVADDPAATRLDPTANAAHMSHQAG